MPCPLVIPVTWEKSGELGSEFILGYTTQSKGSVGYRRPFFRKMDFIYTIMTKIELTLCLRKSDSSHPVTRRKLTLLTVAQLSTVM